MTRGWKWFLIASLVLNVAFVGMLSGEVARRDVPPHLRPVAGLSPERQAEFRAAMEGMRGPEDKQSGMRALREDMLRLLSAEQFDDAAYRAQMQKLRLMRARQRDRFGETIEKLAKTWPAADRRALAEHLRHPPCPPGGRVEEGRPSEEPAK